MTRPLRGILSAEEKSRIKAICVELGIEFERNTVTHNGDAREIVLLVAYRLAENVKRGLKLDGSVTIAGGADRKLAGNVQSWRLADELCKAGFAKEWIVTSYGGLPRFPRASFCREVSSKNLS